MRIIFFALCFLSFSQAFSQKLWVDVYAGATNYQGDLQDKRYTFNQAHIAGGAGVSYMFNDRWAARLHTLFGKISADDKFGRNKNRNLNFTSSISEFQLGVQYFITPFNSRSLTPYVFAGVAAFHFNPYTTDSNQSKHYLKPLSTEGQGFVDGRKEYGLTQIAIPFGGGVKLSLSDNLNVGIEMGLRKTFTDYLDDVSTRYVDQSLLLSEKGPTAVALAYRGDELKNGGTYPDANSIRGSSKYKDWYYFTGITLSFRLGAGGFGGGGRHNQYDCPVNVKNR